MTAPKPVTLRPKTLWLLDQALIFISQATGVGGHESVRQCCEALRQDLIDSGVNLAEVASETSE